METTGERVRALRESRGWNQDRLANELTVHGADVKQSRVSSMERSEDPPPAHVLMALSRVFGVTVDYLLGLSEPPGEQGLTELPEQARELIETYLGLPYTFREMVLRLARDLGMVHGVIREQDAQVIETLVSILREISADDTEFTARLTQSIGAFRNRFSR